MNTAYLIYLILGVIFFGLTCFVYGKSKTWADRIRFTLIPVSITISILFVYYIMASWSYYISSTPKSMQFKTIYHLPFIFVFIIEYLLISSIAVSFAAWKKGGYSKLKEIKNGGILRALLGGLLLALLGGLLGGLLLALLEGFLVGFLVGLLRGFLGILLAGLLLELLGEFPVGLLLEFKKDKKTKNNQR